MSDIIQLLPDHLANQIAAGEVIQRPASAVKELLENAVDAGATSVQLIIEDAGKALVQVIDNGKGMSATDARMAFERHATSKIKSIEDLFNIRTMGFRGEALASIAAVAQVELKTRRAEDELGTRIFIENSKVTDQEPVNHPVGTSIAMKNVFFNVPARRNFLKSNSTELRNIIDEFTRVAMAFPNVQFTMHSNGQQVFFLEKGSAKQRIVQLLGNQYNAKLVAINDDTDYMVIRGFIGKPDTARKTRGDQYFFVNNRFIKSAYLNHAVTNAYDNLIAKDSYPSYVLYIDLDPTEVDINVHPTKQEIKFTDEKIAYAFVQAAIKHGLAQFSLSPSLDFSLNADIQQLDAVHQPVTDGMTEKVQSSKLFQAFSQKNQAHIIEPDTPAPASNFTGWQQTKEQNKEIQKSIAGQKDNPQTEVWQSELSKLRNSFFDTSSKTAFEGFDHEHRPASKEARFGWLPNTPLIQLHNTYIVASSTDGYMLIHQHNAHERIMYEQLSKAIHGKAVATQQNLFPVSIMLSPADTVLLAEILPDLKQLGYQIEPDDSGAFIIKGTPADVEIGNEQKQVEDMLERLKHFNSDIKFSKREKLIRTLAYQQSIKTGRYLTEKEMTAVVEQLFLCATPNTTPGGQPTYVSYKLGQLERMFG
ncbi:DNA mismatch repair endonuclease MutL [Polluticaenibacter yanchengensis]|uniref:DNA mismatch repair protein MutL n=1 Tax=Polluticaenibacter yanchengensis TaxID=3014562 RepID=A0ABT4UJS5_9BACT|nr:DNA mismatch repair endonuclease MutL [Chitinophagaceae bacterium LY-5]